MPEIEIAVDINLSITDAAEKFFKRYTKARNAGVEIEKRLSAVRVEIEKLAAQKNRLETAIAERDEEVLCRICRKKKGIARFAGKKKKGPNLTGRVVSSLGGIRDISRQRPER